MLCGEGSGSGESYQSTLVSTSTTPRRRLRRLAKFIVASLSRLVSRTYGELNVCRTSNNAIVPFLPVCDFSPGLCTLHTMSERAKKSVEVWHYWEPGQWEADGPVSARPAQTLIRRALKNKMTPGGLEPTSTVPVCCPWLKRSAITGLFHCTNCWSERGGVGRST